MPPRKIKVGVIGCGYMGKNHCRIYHELEESELLWVSDIPEKEAEIKEKYAVNFSPKYEDILDKVEAVSIASPTTTHFEVAKACLEKGLHCLIEKPLAASAAEAKKLAGLARKHKKQIVTVGYVQRFNPAFQALLKVLAEDEILAIDARRMHPPLNRATDVSAVYDLMTHDIDLVLSLVDSRAKKIFACGSSTNSRLDHVVAEIAFENGVIANLTASKIAKRQIRELHILGKNNFYAVDLLHNELVIHRGKEESLKKVVVPTREPLKDEIRHFLDSIEKNSPPSITVDNGLNNLEIVEKIERLTKE